MKKVSLELEFTDALLKAIEEYKEKYNLSEQEIYNEAMSHFFYDIVGSYSTNVDEELK